MAAPGRLAGNPAEFPWAESKNSAARDEPGTGPYEAGQVQAAPQPQVSPQRQPARRAALLSWHPHAQVAPAQEPQQRVVFFVI